MSHCTASVWRIEIKKSAKSFSKILKITLCTDSGFRIPQDSINFIRLGFHLTKTLPSYDIHIILNYYAAALFSIFIGDSRNQRYCIPSWQSRQSGNVCPIFSLSSWPLISCIRLHKFSDSSDASDHMHLKVSFENRFLVVASSLVLGNCMFANCSPTSGWHLVTVKIKSETNLSWKLSRHPIPIRSPDRKSVV